METNNKFESKFLNFPFLMLKSLLFGDSLYNLL